MRSGIILKHRNKRHLFLLSAAIGLLLVFAIFKVKGSLGILPLMINREAQAREAEAVLRHDLEEAGEQRQAPATETTARRKVGVALSFSAVKKLLLTSDRKSLGGIGKIVTADQGFYGYQIVRLPEGGFFYRLGARKGDIIRKIEADHPVQLASDLDLYALLVRLHEVPELTISIERDEKNRKFTFVNNDLQPE